MAAHSPNRPDVLVFSSARLVDEDAAPLPDRQPSRAGQVVPRAHPGGEDHHVDVEGQVAGRGKA
jgi:hypothetical protein